MPRESEEFPVMHRLRRLEDKMFLPVQSPPCSCLSAIFARVPSFIELYADMLLFLGPAGTPKTPASALAGWLGWLECCPHAPKVCGFITG